MEKTPLFHTRPACVCALGTGAGLFVGALLAGRDGFAAGTVVLLLSGLSMLLGRRRFALLFLFAALALVRVGIAEQAPFPYGRCVLSGTVAAEPSKNATGGCTVLLGDVTVDGVPAEGRVQSFLKPVIAPVPGQRITFTAKTRPVGSSTIGYYRYLGVAATAEAEEDAETVFSEPPKGWQGLKNRVRASLRARVDALFPENGALIAAFLLGDQRGLTEDTREAFQAAGVAHLLAVSGLHVSILAAAVSYCIRLPGLWTRFWLMSVFLLGYCILTSFHPSVVRASVMFLAGALAVPLKRSPDSISALAFSFTVLALANPYVVEYVGFQLSFLAAYGIVTLGPVLSRATRRLGSAASSAVSGTASAWIGTLPAVCRFFGTVPVVGLAVNVLVLPLFAFLIVPAFAAIALSYAFLPLGRLLAAAPALLLKGLIAVIDAAAGSMAAVPAPGYAALGLWMLSLLAASKLFMAEKRTRAIVSLALLAASLLVWRI